MTGSDHERDPSLRVETKAASGRTLISVRSPRHGQACDDDRTSRPRGAPRWIGDGESHPSVFVARGTVTRRQDPHVFAHDPSKPTGEVLEHWDHPSQPEGHEANRLEVEPSHQ